MKKNIFKYPLSVLGLLAFVVITFFACQKHINNTDPLAPVIPIDHTLKDNTALISGFVTNKSSGVIEFATVTIGGLKVTTDKYGYFQVRNVIVPETVATITVSKSGYFDITKTFFPSKEKSAFFRIVMLSKDNIGTIDAVTGGSVYHVPGPGSSNGIAVQLSLPANAVEDAASGSLYSGKVSVFAQVPNIYLSKFYRMIPGDLRCIDSSKKEKKIESKIVIFIELRGSGGETLQIAKDKKATLTTTLPSGIINSMPAITPVWHFDNTTGLWKNEGQAIKTGNKLIGEISRVGCLNYSRIVFENLLSFDCTVLDAEGFPIPNILIGIEHISGTTNYLYTDSSGYIKGVIPANTQVTLQIYSRGTPEYNNIIYTKPIITSNLDVSLGTIVVSSDRIVTALGSVRDCDNAGLKSDGYIMAGDVFGLQAGDNYRFNLPAANNGIFRFNIDYLSLDYPLYLIATNSKTSYSSQQIFVDRNPGKQIVAPIQVCNQPTFQYVNFTVDGVEYSKYSPVDSFSQTGYYIDPSNPLLGEKVSISGVNYVSKMGLSMDFDRKNIGVNREQLITFMEFSPPYVQTFNLQSPWVTITEYGNIGEFISGSFKATAINNDYPSPTKYNLMGNFRLRRKQ